ncbi:MAG: TIGR00266 family protein [Actinomycetota bacterium]|nr:TIGR00266 family protein [Actinomycetota bacterium]
MQDKIIGTTMPVLEVGLDPGESVVSESGEFSWMSGAVQMATGMGGGIGGKGLMGALKRAAGGSSLLFNTFTAEGSPGFVSFAAKLPGQILPVDLGAEAEYFAHRHGFLAGVPGVQVSIGFQQSFRGGIFGGEGFILQRLAGNGRAWVELSGEVVTFDLDPGQVMRVHPGHVGLFQASVSFQVERVPGIANRYFGGDAHHFVVLTGPGRIWLQSMPVTVLAASLMPYLGDAGAGRTAAAGASGGVAGGILGGILRS